MEILQNFLQQTITFFAIMDPIGISAVALSLLSTNITKTEIHSVARKSSITIIIAFFVVLTTGDLVLKIFGIGADSLKVMGGIILLLMAISMVNGNSKEKTKNGSKNNEDLAVIPIGIPIAFGAGLFTTIVIFKHQAQTFLDLVSISFAFCINALVFYLILRKLYLYKNIWVLQDRISSQNLWV